MVDILHQEGDTVLAEQVVAIFESGAVTGTSTSAPAESAARVAASAPVSATATSGQSIDIKVPTLPESVADATIALWRVKEGDQIASDDILVDLETDKIVLEVPAPEAGVMGALHVAEGDTVQADQVIASLMIGAAPAAQAPVAAQAPAAHESTADELSPSVRRMVAELGIDVSKVQGTGVGGRVTKADIEAFQQQQPSKAPPVAAVTTPSMTPMGARDQKRVPMTRLRQRIAQRLLEAKNATAMLTTFNEVNMKPIMDLRKQYKDRFEKQHDVRLGFMSFYVKAVTEALKRFPAINASIDGTDIVYHNYFDISVAISTPRGW